MAVTCRCPATHVHASATQSERTQEGSVETPVVVCLVDRCRCVLMSWPMGQGEIG